MADYTAPTGAITATLLDVVQALPVARVGDIDRDHHHRLR